jgi:hypothetical protein
MHDTRLEGQLRSALRTDADGLPFTITADELRRRLALRRRGQSRRRVGLLAAGVASLAVGSVFALASGLFAPPNAAIAPLPQPSVTATPTPTPARATPPTAVLPLKGHPDGSPIAAILPTDAGPTHTHRFTLEGSRTTSGRVWVHCRRPGSATVESGAEKMDVPCEARLEPQAFEVPLSDTEQVIAVTVSPGIRYAILVETIPLPTELPALDPLTEPAQVEGGSSNAMPDWDAPAVLVTTMVGRIQPGPYAEVKFVCLGPGTIEIALREPGAPLTDPAISGMTIQCHGQPDGLTSSIGDAGPLDVIVSTSPAVAWKLAAAGVGAGPSPGPSD